MQEERRDRRAGKRTVQQMAAVGLVASALGIALGILIDWFPQAGSTQAGPIDTLWDVLVIVSVPIFVLVTVVVLFAVLRFRMRPGEEQLDGPPIHGNTRLEVVWTALPAILLVSLCTYAYLVLRDIEQEPASASSERVVSVTARQFTWLFEYDEGGKKFTSPQLYLPAGESVRFEIRSEDVIHNFWVPDFRMKIDAVPGITTTYRVTPKQSAIGDHDIVCAELCGLGHAFMRQTAHVQSSEDFDAWVEKMTAAPSGGEAEGGGEVTAADAKTLFTQGSDTGALACGSCHALADAGATGRNGPDLDQVLEGKDAAHIKASIIDPDAEITSGYGAGIMPPNYDQLLTTEQVDALASYLSEVTK